MAIDFVEDAPAIDFQPDETKLESGLVEPKPSYFKPVPYSGGAFESPAPLDLVRDPKMVSEGLYNTLAKTGSSLISPGSAALGALAPVQALRIPPAAYFGVKGAEAAGTGIGEMIAQPPKTAGEAVERGGDVAAQLLMAGGPVAEVVDSAYKNPKTGEVTAGPTHVEAAAEQGVKAPEAKEARETKDFGFIVEDPKTGATEFKTRPETEPIAKVSGQLIQEPERPGQPHSDDIAAPGTDKPLSESKVPPAVQEQGTQPEVLSVGKAEGGGEAPPAPATAEPTTEPPKPQGEAGLVGMGGALAEGEIVQGTALKNATADLERVGIGLPEAYPTVRQNMAKAWIKSGEVEAKSPGAGKALADDLIQNPERGLTDEDSALLLRHKVELWNKLNDAAERTNKGTPKERAAAQAEHAALAEQYGNLLDAVKFRGSQWGREGRWRQAMAKEDYDFASTDGMNRYFRSETGKDMTPEQTTQAAKRAKVVKVAQDSLQKTTTALSNEIDRVDMTAAEKRALDAASKTVRENAIRVSEAENKQRVAKTVREKKTADLQADAAKKALKVANDVSRKAASALAEAENKARSAEAERQNAEQKVQEDAENRAKKAIEELHKQNAIRLAKQDVENRKSGVRSEESRKVQEQANQRALEAAEKAIRDKAVAEAKAANAKRIKDSERSKSTADVQLKASQKALDAAQMVSRKAAAKLAEAERKSQADPLKRVWDKAKEYLDQNQGVLGSMDQMIQKVATDLGLKREQVIRMMAQNKKIKFLTEEAFRKQQNVRILQGQAKQWVRNLTTPGWLKALSSIPRFMFNMKVGAGLHGFVPLGTHAPMVVFQPKFWEVYTKNYGKMQRMVFDTAYHERMVQDLVRDPNYTKAQQAGLVNNPFEQEELAQSPVGGKVAEIAPGFAEGWNRVTGAGNRGYSILKFLRQDMFNQAWDKLPKTQQIPEVAKGIATAINHSTGVTKAPAPKYAHIFLFAPRLEASRVAWLAVDPAKALITFSRWNKATPGEKAFARYVIQEKAWVAGTMFGLLALCQGMLSATGSKQKINLTDPTAGDFLHFKIAGLDISYGNPMISMAKLPLRVGMVGARGQGGKLAKVIPPDERAYDVLGRYARSQASPFAGLGADLTFRQDPTGRPLPSSNQPVPIRLRKQGVQPYSWKEFATETVLPIPAQEAVKDVWKYGLGMSDKQIEEYMKAFAKTSFMAETGARVYQDKTVPPTASQ